MKLRLKFKVLPARPRTIFFTFNHPSLPEMPFLLLLASFSYCLESAPEWRCSDVTKSTLRRSPTTFLPEAAEALPPLLHNLPHGKTVSRCTRACAHTPMPCRDWLHSAVFILELLASPAHFWTSSLLSPLPRPLLIRWLTSCGRVPPGSPSKYNFQGTLILSTLHK